jgi:hypothetical protein
MDVSIREVIYYRCNVIINIFLLIFLIENICLIPCRYLFNLKKKRLRTRRMLRLQYVRPILLRRSQHLFHTISSLIWQQESTAFHGMMMVVKCLRVRTCQYSPILDDPHLKNVARGRYLSEIEFKQAHNYVLFNYDELRFFIQ